MQNLLAYPGLGHSGPLDLDGGGSSGGECPSVCTSGTPQVSTLPPAMRVRLYELFVQIEREFEILYAENISLQVINFFVLIFNEKLGSWNSITIRSLYATDFCVISFPFLHPLLSHASLNPPTTINPKCITICNQVFIVILGKNGM